MTCQRLPPAADGAATATAWTDNVTASATSCRLNSAETSPCRAAIVGCGNIGARWDEGRNTPGSTTHAGAYRACASTLLAAAADSDGRRLEAFGRAWGVKALYPDLLTLLATEQVDILSIATPAADHPISLHQALAAGVRSIFLEKPLAPDLATAHTMAAAARDHGARVAVNFSRRWDPGMRQVAQLVRGRAIGPPQLLVGHYGKGLLNNGSHMLDLLLACGLAPVEVEALQQTDSGITHDPTLDLRLEMDSGDGRCRAYLLGSDSRAFTLFELEILGTAGRLNILDSGRRIEHYPVEQDPLFPAYRHLGMAHPIPAEPLRAMERAVAELAACHRAASGRPACTIDDALLVMRLVEAARRSFAARRPVALEEIP